MNKVLTIKGQMIVCVIMPEDSVWDMAQVTGTITFRNGSVCERGLGDFEFDGYRVFAEDVRTAKMMVRYLIKEGYLPRN